jgi:hypothetical protein
MGATARIMRAPRGCCGSRLPFRLSDGYLGKPVATDRGHSRRASRCRRSARRPRVTDGCA